MVVTYNPMRMRPVRELDVKSSVRAATTAAVANLAAAPVAQDGVTLVEGDRVLVKDGASLDGVEATHAKRNGVYTVGVVAGGLAPWTRAVDADDNPEVTTGMVVFAAQGATNGQESYVLTTLDPIVVDTTALAFSKISAGEADAVLADELLTNGEAAAATVAGSLLYSSGAAAFKLALASNADAATHAASMYAGGVIAAGAAGKTLALAGTIKGVPKQAGFAPTGGERAYLSATEAGKVTGTPPATSGHWVVPVGFMLDGADLIVAPGMTSQNA